MKNYQSNTAILVLESPWNLYHGDANKASVLPFINGIAKHNGNTEVFYANFYDKNSYVSALECLCKIKFDSTTVYIAGHGDTAGIAGMKTSDLLWEVGYLSKKYNITGVMLGACWAGTDTATLIDWTQETNIKWCAGYTTSVYWLEGTMIDCAILSSMSQLERDDFVTESNLIDAFGQAISPFSTTAVVGEGENGEPTRFRNSMEFVIRAARQGCRPKVVTADVFNEWQEAQQPEGES